MSPFTSAFDDAVREAQRKWHIPGVAFSVVHGDQSWCKGYGIAQLPSEPVTPTTLFYAASTTKAHLCAAWALYIASEKNQTSSHVIQWSTPLANIIPGDFVLADPTLTYEVTLEDAVSHRTGMPRYELCYGREDIRTHEAVTRVLRHLPMHNSLRTKFEYCNTMFAVASHALEVASGRSLLDILHKDLWEPLGMTSTYGDAEASLVAKNGDAVFAKYYNWSRVPSDLDTDQGKLCEEPAADLTPISGAGFVVSTVEDYARWMRCWLNKSGPLSHDMIDELWTPRSIIPRDQLVQPFEGVSTYCLGWRRSIYRGEDVLSHTGGVPGGGSLVILLPQRRWGVTLLANGTDPAITLKSTAFWLVDDFLKTPEGYKKLAAIDDEALEFYKKLQEKYRSGRQDLYPNGPSRSTPPDLPLSSYTGTFAHPGLGPITLQANRTPDGEQYLSSHIQRTFSCDIELYHVNAGWWLGISREGSGATRECFRGKSVVDVSGEVEAWEMALEPSMPHEMMRFVRVGALLRPSVVDERM